VRRHHSGPPKEGWAYVFPNTGETRLVNVQNPAGFTPLHYAVWVGRKQAIQVGMQCSGQQATHDAPYKTPAALAAMVHAKGLAACLFSAWCAELAEYAAAAMLFL
jgi:hypothetical protein